MNGRASSWDWSDEPEDGPEVDAAERRAAEGPDPDEWMAAQDRWERDGY